MTGTDKQGPSRFFLQWLLACIVGVCVLALILLGVLNSRNAEEFSPLFWAVTSEPGFMGESVKISNEELIALIVSLVVVIQVIASFKSFKRIPHKVLLLSSFVAMVLSTVFTIAEGVVFGEALNFLEHFSVMAESILLAVWCVLVFGSQRQEHP